MPRPDTLGKPDQLADRAPIGRLPWLAPQILSSRRFTIDFPKGKTPQKRSLKPPPTMETLKFLLQSKKAAASAHEVVDEAVSWMHTQLRNADIAYHYSDGGAGYGHYGYFQIKSLLMETAITLHLKIAEINGIPIVPPRSTCAGTRRVSSSPTSGKSAAKRGNSPSSTSLPTFC